uniref:Putative polyprotein n=1 Tax=Albugo laibachii Nc14 TaxID=890382 RepID=F0W3P2_9STRA|nr:putative polyprotein [Albugo laibachii Nc14]|eukprot:CCA15712.1 putative polyprotein [Albugo laibachii Nc14]
MIRTLTERARCMLSHMQLEEKWWAEVLNTAVYVTNRVPCAANEFKTPFEVCYGRKPSVAHFKVFGAQGYAHIDKSKRSKFDRKAYKCMFMGYFENIKGYRVWNLGAHRLETTRSAKFQELQHSKYVKVVCCDKSMDRINSMKNQHYEKDDMPLESQHNSDDAIEIDKEFNDQDADTAEDDSNMEINIEKGLFLGGDWMVLLAIQNSHHLGPITFPKVSRLI